MIEIVALIGIAVAAGLLAGLLGIGGGIVIVPALAALLIAQGASLDIAMPMAVATALGSMLMTSAASALAHSRRGAVDWPAVIRLGPSLAFGALVGAWLATHVPGVMLARIFAILAGLIGLHMLVGAAAPARPVASKPRWWGFFAPLFGALSAMIGIGGGSFNVPYLRYNGYSTLHAIAIAAACGWPIALAGSAGFVAAGWNLELWPGALGYWYLPGVFVIGVVGMLSAPWGARLGHRIGSVGLSRLFGIFLLVVAGRMLLQ
ncbi:MAG: sulfite exporter TauE/SafE family protein [Wenzhouxiangellaceae bacterium]